MPHLIRRAALAGLLLLVGCDNKTATTAPPSLPPPAVTVVPVVAAPVTESVRFLGLIKPIEEVELMARVEGFLLERRFTEGSDVKKGDLLFRIDPEPYQAEQRRIEAELQKAKAEQTRTRLTLQRVQALRDKQLLSQAEFDKVLADDQKAEADIRIKQAELRKAQLDLSYTEIRAPVSGRIGRAEFSVGDLIKDDGPALATLVTLDPVYVYWEASDNLLLPYRRQVPDLVKRGKPAIKAVPTLLFEDGTTYAHAGSVDFIDNQVNRETSTQRLRAVFPNPEKLLMPGQFINVALDIGEAARRLLVPQAAILADSQGYFVLTVADDNIAVMQRVEMGARHGNDWIVKSGLKEGEQVIVQGNQKAQPGQVVAPTRSPAG